MTDSASTSPAANAKAQADREELTRVIQARVLQGYRVESLTDSRVVLVANGHRRWFGMRSGRERRTEVTIGERGRAVTRNL